MLVVSGCISPPAGQQGNPQPNQTANKTCRTVIDEVPDTKEQCGDITFSEPVCNMRNLNYSVTRPPKVDLCISDGVCLGKPLGDCQGCAKAMTRCILQVHNTESQKTGSWTVGANFSIGNFGFNKDPITRTIGPNQTADFDFNQIYTPDYPINSASCSLAVISEPTIEDCIQVTRTKTECRNVTSTTKIQREVCE
jgi:hypothetical protein